MESKRVTWLDDARGICVFCVLLAHSGIEHHYLYTLYTPFFLTTFFFISGLLYKNTTLKDDILKIVKHLLIPYFLLNLLIIFIGIDNWKALFHGDYSFLYGKLKDTFLGYNMWFIPCIIMVQLYVTLLYHIYMKTLVLKACTAFCLMFTVYLIKNDDNSFMYWYMDIALFSSFFFLLGNIVKSIFGYSEWLPNFKFKKILSVSILIIYFCFSFLLQDSINMEFHYAYNYYEKPLLFILLSILGIVSICIFFQSVNIKFFNILGRNSLTFFAFNGKAKSLALLLLPKFFYFESYTIVLLLCLIESFILIFVSTLINKYCPWLIGKYKIK